MTATFAAQVHFRGCDPLIKEICLPPWLSAGAKPPRWSDTCLLSVPGTPIIPPQLPPPATSYSLPRLRRFPHASCRPPYARLLNALIKDGRTLLLVSHAGRLLGEVCQRCIYLEGGQVKYDGATSEAVRRYEEASAATVAA